MVLTDHADPVATALAAAGFTPRVASKVTSAVRALRETHVDVVITSVELSGMDGLALCERLATDHGDVPVVVIVPPDDTDLLDRATRAGAFGCLALPLDEKALALLVDRAVEHRTLRSEVERLELAMQESLSYEDLLGGSPIMQELFDLIDRAGASDAAILLVGESGTGKEVVAQALHARSRRVGRFVPVNLAAIPEGLIESELFGHEKGAFTDARRRRDGVFVEANAGTLFLDEVGELPLHLQPKLLRALQKRVVRPVGGDREISVDIRVIAATNRDLESMVAEGAFREDLFWRLDVIRIELPPLRSRGSDILLLADHFVERVAARGNKEIEGFSNAAAKRLLEYRWPGNVRELENCVERAVALSRASEIQIDDLPRRIREYRADHIVVAASDPEELVPMHVVEARYIARVLAEVGGNKTHAARVLGFDRKTLHRKMKRYGLS